MNYRIEPVLFPATPGATMPADHLKALQALAARAEVLFPDHVADMSQMRWRDRLTAYGEAMGSLTASLRTNEPEVFGGWRIDEDTDESTVNPNPRPGEPKWWPKDGASFQVTREAPSPTDFQGRAYLTVYREESPADALRTVTIELKNDSGAPATALELFLSVRRSHVPRVTVIQGERRDLVNDPKVDRGRFSGDLPRTLVPEELVMLEIEFAGDLPYVRQAVWVAEGTLAVDWSAGVLPRGVGKPERERLAQFKLTVDDEFAEREALIQGFSSPRGEYALMFLELDRATTPREGDPDSWRVTQLASYLARRTMIRAEDAAFGEDSPRSEAELDDWSAFTQPTALLVKGIFTRHFPELVQGNTTRIAEAFEQFATGAQRVLDTHGVPNGISYFSFCELAILMTELNPTDTFWPQLIPVFARTSELMIECFHQCGGSRRRESYGALYNPLSQRSTPAQLDRNRQEWSTVSNHAYAFARIVHAALAEDLVQGHVTPFALRDVGCAAPNPPPSSPDQSNREWRGNRRAGSGLA